jgi:hypothetical protein
MFLRIHVLRFEDETDFIENARNMIGKLPVGEIVGMLDLGVAKDELHPAVSELRLLPTQGGGKVVQGADGNLAHARVP